MKLREHSIRVAQVNRRLAKDTEDCDQEAKNIEYLVNEQVLEVLKNARLRVPRSLEPKDPIMKACNDFHNWVDEQIEKREP